jgi:hypothetical protein
MIYILPVKELFRPCSQPFKYPAHNEDYGVEQDFLNYINQNQHLITEDPKKADFHYLPVFWTRWHLCHDFGTYGSDELRLEVNRVILDDTKTFTICQYSDGPLIVLGKTLLFLASRQTTTGFDIPLLCSPHQRPPQLPFKKYLASFTGNLATHPVRGELFELCKDNEAYFIRNGNYGTDFFTRTILESYISLCPRGYGGSSFRFFESMQLGVVPYLIGDLDTRPFKEYLDWDKNSFYSETPHIMIQTIDEIPKTRLTAMGIKSLTLWKNELFYGKWCKYLIKQLLDLKKERCQPHPS